MGQKYIYGVNMWKTLYSWIIIYYLFSIPTASYKPVFTPPCVVGARMCFSQKPSHSICVSHMTGFKLVPFVQVETEHQSLPARTLDGLNGAQVGGSASAAPPCPFLTTQKRLPPLVLREGVTGVRKHACSSVKPAAVLCGQAARKVFTSEVRQRESPLVHRPLGLGLLLVLFRCHSLLASSNTCTFWNRPGLPGHRSVIST